jgi:hypothetical protein
MSFETEMFPETSLMFSQLTADNPNDFIGLFFLYGVILS